MKKFEDLDPLLHNQVRLAVMSVLITKKEAEFTYLKELTQATAGNLSAAITKLKEAGYIEVEKSFKNNYPQTLCRISTAGLAAFEKYVLSLNSYFSNTG